MDKNEEFEGEFIEMLDEDEDYSQYQPRQNNVQKENILSNDKKVVEKNGQTMGKTAEGAGNTVQAAGKGIQAAGKGVQTVGKGVQAAGKGVQLAGKGVQAAGKGVQTAGKGVETVGTAAGSAMSAIPVVGTALGAITTGASKAVGTGAQATGKATEIAGKATEKAGKATEKAGKATEKAGKATEKAGKATEKAGNKVQGAIEAVKLIDKPKKFGKKMIILIILGFFSIIIILCSIVGTDNFEKIMDILNTMNKVENMIDEFFYHKNTNSTSEDYNNMCVGAISQILISELSLPVKINSDSVTFTGEYAYGITTTQMHNGVDLNVETTGTKDGDDIYAIADGEVVDIATDISCNKSTDENCDSKGSWIKLKHAIVAGETTYDFYSVYMNMQSGSSILKKGDKVNKDDVIGKVGMTGDATIAQLHFEFHNENDTPIDPTNLFIPCTNSQLVGDSAEEQIWFYFRNQGYSEAATAGAMGNLQAESGLEPRSVQGDLPFSDYSINYTAQVDNNTISRDDFVFNGPNGGGYGLAQWTSSGRKENLYSYKEKNNSSIGDLQTQLEYLMTEVSGPGWGSSSKHKIWENSSGDNDVNTAADAYCESFERPAECNYTDRRNNAQAIYDRNKGKSLSTSDVSMGQTSQLRKQIVAYATSFVGNRYVYGGSWNGELPYTPTDCSGFTSGVYKHFGYNLARNSISQLNNGKPITEEQLRPGDLIIYSKKNNIGHVAIYIGNNKIVHAASTASGVKISNSYKYREIAGYRNIIGD